MDVDYSVSRYLEIAKGRALEHQLKLHNNIETRQDSYHAAIVVAGGRIVATGVNYKSNRAHDYYRGCESKQARLNKFFHDAYKFNHKRPLNDYHAEMDAILDCDNLDLLKGAKIYVARVNPHGKSANSSPCEMCRHYIPRYGLSRVIYSIGEYDHGVWNVKKQVDVMKAKGMM